jgi:hypothetical protein
MAGALIVMAAVTIVDAHGQGPAPGVIHSCVKNNGDITIVGATDTCKNNETALDWNAQGVPGPAGVSGYEWLVMEVPTGVVPPLGTVGDTLVCPSGKQVFGGGGRVFIESDPADDDPNDFFHVVTSYPGSHLKWTVKLQNTSNAAHSGTLFIYAVCGIVSQ